MRARTNGLVAAVVALLAVGAALAPSAGASTIAFQCGAGVCAVDPDIAGAQQRQLTADGRFAGLTRDGATAAWVDPTGALVKAPAAGGAPQVVWSGGSVGNAPAMSPDGQRFLWWYVGPDPFGGLGSVYISRLTLGMERSEGVSHCVYCTTSHGWLGGTSIAAFPGDDRAPSRICRVATSAELPELRSSCAQVLVSEARGGLAFPTGSPDGSEIAAALSVGRQNEFRGRIVRYSTATGAPIGDVTDATADTTPAYSSDGRQLAFDRGGQIVVRDLASGTERVVAQGVYPFWGGERTLPPPVPQPPRAARRPPLLSLSGQATPRALAAGGLRLTVRCARACRASVRLTVAAKDARKLGLRRGAALASASGARRRSGALVLRPLPAARYAGRLRALGSLRVDFDVVIRPAKGARGRTTLAGTTVQLLR